MNNSWFSLTISFGWVALSFILAVAAAFLLYSKKGVPWRRNIDLLLGFLRFSTLFLIVLLLFNPLLKMSVNDEEPPVILFAVDDSQSIDLRMGDEELATIRKWINDNLEDLRGRYEARLHLLSEKSGDSLKFDFQRSNLSNLLNRINQQYEGRNVGSVLLFSDGIYNEGVSPRQVLPRYPVYTIGLGDTIPPRDLAISNVRHNRVAYQGNEFPVLVELTQQGYANESVQVTIYDGQKRLASRQVQLTQPFISTEFVLPASEPGLRHLKVSVQELEDESTLINNYRDIFIDVIEGKDKVLIIAPGPHPDIKAIRQVLTEASSYETTLYIPGVSQAPSEKNFDVIIEHQAFGSVKGEPYQATGRLYILGPGTQIPMLNRSLPYLNISTVRNQKDQVRAAINPGFDKFKLTPDLQERVKNYPPVTVPFGEYQLSGPTETLLFQQIGSVTSSRPLLIFFDDGTTKSAVMIGGGLWQWRLQEAAQEGDSRLFSELILKTVQLLSTRTDKNRFVIKPRKNVFSEGEAIFFDTQVYNELYERSYGHQIRLTITSEAGETSNYEMTDSPINSSLNIGSLNPGVYRYNGSVTVGNQTFTEEGEFLVDAIQIEALKLTADHNLLKSIADRSGGAFYHYTQLEQLENHLKESEFNSIIRTFESYFPLIESIWLLILIVVLICTEWFLRKFLGAY